jgi:hypothetical protein
MLAINSHDIVLKIKDLSILDFSLMSFISYELKKKLEIYFQIDSFTMPDPFPIKHDFKYFIVVDKSNTNRIISFIAIKNDIDSAVWNVILGEEVSRLELPADDIFSLKEELLPKHNNNFYPLRKNGSIIGFVAFAFEICGKKDI